MSPKEKREARAAEFMAALATMKRNDTVLFEYETEIDGQKVTVRRYAETKPITEAAVQAALTKGE